MSYLLTPTAQGDLDDIWNAATRSGNSGIAARSIFAIRDACKALAAGLGDLAIINHIKPGYFHSPVGEHILFFTITAAGDFEIVRILHERMNGAWPKS